MFSTPVSTCQSCPISLTAGGRCPFTPTKVPASAVICAQGERHPSIYFVREGAVTVSAVDEAGNERSVSVRGPRSLLCLEALRGTASPSEVRALSDVRLCGLPVEEISRWLGQEGTPARHLLELLMTELERHQGDIQWRSGDSLARVARFLQTVGLRPKGASPLSKQLVARVLAMRPETFSRCLTQLTERGIVSRNGRVLDTDALAQIAAGLSETESRAEA